MVDNDEVCSDDHATDDGSEDGNLKSVTSLR